MTLSGAQAQLAPDAAAHVDKMNGALASPSPLEPKQEPEPNVLHQRSVTASAKKEGGEMGQREAVEEGEREGMKMKTKTKAKANDDVNFDGGSEQDGGDGLNKKAEVEEEYRNGGGFVAGNILDGSSGGSSSIAEEDKDDPLSGLPIPRDLPNVVAIKKAIPAHCFTPNAWLSLYFMAKDFIIVAALYTMTEWSFKALPLATQLVITPLYWLVQGVLFTAIFVVGHDAGHGSFSQSRLLNDLCGNLCHAFLFCPYFMWKLSHRNHHKNTGNIDKEEVYYPVRRSELKSSYNRMLPGFGLGVGWFTYLVRGYRPRMVAHFNPFHPLFKNHALDCLISLAFLAGWTFCLHQYWAHCGLASLVYHWVVPTLVFGSFIVIITFLHHTDTGVPWYADGLWNYVRGQLSSVDRHYGWCHSIIHNIGTHQIHHLFPIIPHYRLEEATVHFRKSFPDLVCIKSERILPAFYRMFKKYMLQSVIPDNSVVHVYR